MSGLQRLSPACPADFKARALLIDMDGTLFDTETRSIDSIIEIIARQGLTVTREFLISHMGIGPQDAKRLYCEHLGPTFDWQLYFDTYWQERNAHYTEHGMPVMHGARALLEAAREKGVPCILASSSPQKQVIHSLERAGVYAYFKDVVGGDMFAHSKPEPDIYLKAAELAGIPAEQCLVLEDSLNGLKSGHAAGTRTVMIPDVVPFSERHAPYCDYLCESLTDVISLL